MRDMYTHYKQYTTLAYIPTINVHMIFIKYSPLPVKINTMLLYIVLFAPVYMNHHIYTHYNYYIYQTQHPQTPAYYTRYFSIHAYRTYT